MSDWIEHDGQCVPEPVGTLVDVEYMKAGIIRSRVGQRWLVGYGGSWIWANQKLWPSLDLILRYRVVGDRKMKLLHQIAANPKAPIRETADA